MPLPMMNTSSSRSGARARPISRCSLGSSPRFSDNCTAATSASGYITLSGTNYQDNVQLVVGNNDVNQNQSNPSILVLGGRNTLFVDEILVGGKKQPGMMRWCRERGLEEGDALVFERLDERRYRLTLEKRAGG